MHLLRVIVPGVPVDHGKHVDQVLVVLVRLGNRGQESLRGLELGPVHLFQGLDVDIVFLPERKNLRKQTNGERKKRITNLVADPLDLVKVGPVDGMVGDLTDVKALIATKESGLFHRWVVELLAAAEKKQSAKEESGKKRMMKKMGSLTPQGDGTW